MSLAVVHGPVPGVTVGGRRMRDYRTAPKPEPHTHGRTGACHSCGGEVSGRANKLYCSTACRVRAHRVAQKPTLSRDTLEGLLLSSRWLVGRVSHVADQQGLLVPRSYALDDLNARLPEPVTDGELVAALKALSIIDYKAPVPALAKGLRRVR